MKYIEDNALEDTFSTLFDQNSLHVQRCFWYHKGICSQEFGIINKIFFSVESATANNYADKDVQDGQESDSKLVFNWWNSSPHKDGQEPNDGHFNDCHGEIDRG